MLRQIEGKIRNAFVLAVVATILFVPTKRASPVDDVNTTTLPTLTDNGYQTACGPIACFVAMRLMGVDCSLDTIITKCDWKEGELTTLQSMQDTFADFEKEIVSMPIRVSPQELVDYLESGNYVAVLPIRKRSGEVNHAVCAIGYEEGNVIAVDYPELTQKYSLDKLCDIWDGPVLLVSRSYHGWFTRNLKWLVLPILSVLIFITIKVRGY
ncbi:hypothetical protein F1728_24400 [Gimesia benthica]|uniref:Peptidase C39 domain-containing protein n=1 Tax=Gimesia benthica TaxID=2608982 RepID=A0A6I6AKP9_9PLAN|nr:hypothetical protein [Gimesia benthica]QGQ25630.1 hypothetical protein F1728_24400 [Gimesia benthica]